MTEENKKKNTKKIGLILGIVAAVIVIIGLLPFVVPLNRVTDSITVELGDELTTNLDNYVSGFAPGFWVTGLDVSNVDTNKVGDYTATVKHGFQEFTYTILVRDTTAPVLTLDTENIYLKKGQMYPTNYFVQEAFDLSGDVTITVSDTIMPDFRKTYAYSENCGVYVLSFFAKDTSGNESVYTLSVTVDTAPTISGIKEYYVVPGTTLNYLEFITAFDEVDGDVSENVHVNAENVDLSTVGSYELVYICEDSYGLESEESVAINVMEAMDIQELINTHEIHRLDEIIIGAYNLYDVGCYEDKTMAQMLEIMEPTTIRITNTNSYGSGFILEILDEEIIIGTCQHVVKSADTVGISFFDGTKADGTVVETIYDVDLAFVSVKREDISQELLDKLYTVHINKGYWDALDNEADLEVGVRCITDKGTVWRDRSGKLVYKSGQTDLMWRGLPQVTRVSASLFHGSSGSNIFDIHGNTMGVATYIISGAGRYESYCSTLQTLCDKYEEVFGRKVYYY